MLLLSASQSVSAPLDAHVQCLSPLAWRSHAALLLPYVRLQACSDADAVRLLQPVVAVCRALQQEAARLRQRSQQRQFRVRR